MTQPPYSIDPSFLTVINAKTAWYYRIIPVSVTHSTIEILAEETTQNSGLSDELEVLFNKKISLRKQSNEIIQELLEKYYQKELEDSRLQSVYYTGEADGFLNHLISEARQLNSSDIHIESFEETGRVRIRIDGMLIQRYLLEKKQYPSLINKIKIVANLDIAEKRLPQDGRIFFEHHHHKFDIRVSVLPTLHGEKVVLRLLNNDATKIDIQLVGFSETNLRHYMEGVKRPNGILLISGPTGSGKTTTLYATLKMLNKSTRNILTIEDPIEYTLEGINQVQLKENIGLTFSAALRTFLRQDPDIIMLGEIRDVETANMAIRAALTGHLVLSTIHTNSAWGIISRLIDMGIPPFLLASTINTAVAQRLVRLLCPDCKQRKPFNVSLYPNKFTPYAIIKEHYIAKGCPNCFDTGYKGRKAVYEVIPIDHELSAHIKNGNLNVENLLHEKGIKSLSENSFELFEQGITSLEEIYSLLMN